jgi:hypothetical protein
MQHLTAAYEIKSSKEAVTQEVDIIVEKTLKKLCLILGQQLFGPLIKNPKW